MSQAERWVCPVCDAEPRSLGAAIEHAYDHLAEAVHPMAVGGGVISADQQEARDTGFGPREPLTAAERLERASRRLLR